jgi:mannose-6-phosphate isomerase-like protein (cupin superfamily)
MNSIEIEKTGEELKNRYPGCRVKIAEDGREMVAEIAIGLAIAVIDRSQAHFHCKTLETYRVIRGTLSVACEGRGYVLREGDSITIQPGQIHSARASGEPAWIEVSSVPDWSAEDHFIL